MARPREPIDLLIAKGRKKLTQQEIADRRASEVQPCTDDIVAPGYLTAPQKKTFYKLAGQLQKIKIMGETDCDALARYVTAQTLYEAATKELRKLEKDRPKREDFPEDQQGEYYTRLDLYYTMQDSATRRQDRYFKQAQTAARDLGLTISSRCKIQVPVKEEEPKQNKFARFGGA